MTIALMRTCSVQYLPTVMPLQYKIPLIALISKLCLELGSFFADIWEVLGISLQSNYVLNTNILLLAVAMNMPMTRGCPHWIVDDMKCCRMNVRSISISCMLDLSIRPGLALFKFMSVDERDNSQKVLPDTRWCCGGIHQKATYAVLCHSATLSV